MQKNIETTIVYWGYIGIMESKMATTVAYWENGTENGNCYSIQG